MPIFDYKFTVDAPLTAVSTFHKSPQAFKQLTPFPIIAQIHKNEPMAEGSVTQFTLWFGPHCPFIGRPFTAASASMALPTHKKKGHWENGHIHTMFTAVSEKANKNSRTYRISNMPKRAPKVC